MSGTEEKVLIVGQGLAGTIFSYCLYRKNIPFRIIDNNHKSAATLAAAGIINPITGRRYVKSWKIEELLPVAIEYYEGLEVLLGIKLVKKTSILRAFDNLMQENNWFESTGRPGYAPWIKNKADVSNYDELVNPAFGYGEIDPAIQVDVSLLIKKYRAWLISQNWLIEGSIDSDVDFTESVSYAGEDFSRVVYCEGYKVLENKYFGHLPLQPVKGQSFIVEIENELPDKMLRDKIFIAPLSAHKFWTGGGYDKNISDNDPTQEFIDNWNLKLKNLLKVPYNVVEHRAGIRPAVQGRKPLIGTHPNFSHIHLFNGMGTKGTSLSPYWAEHFASVLLGTAQIDAEVDILRFWED